MRRRSATVVAALSASLVLAGCGGGDAPGQDTPGGMAADGMADDGMGDDGMGDHGMADDGMTSDDMDGMEGMGAGADITVAAEARLTNLPAEPLGWVGYRVEDVAAVDAQRSWGPALLYADEQALAVKVGGAEVMLEPGEATFIEAGTDHTVPAGDFWAFLLTDPDAAAPAGLEGASRELSSGPLDGIPDGDANVRFLIVDLPPRGGQTTVHTHPGPEYIAVVEGDIEYETALEETTVLAVGAEAALPRDTAVQKRNTSEEPARFWSWFIVDPDEPFAAEATFEPR